MSTVTAVSASDTDVQTAVNSAIAGAGDAVVFVPAGSVTWATGISKALTKKLKISGAGSGSTVIAVGGGIAGVVFTGLSATNFCEFSDMTFNGTVVDSNGILQFYGANAGTYEVGLYLHDCAVDLTTSGRGITVNYIYGLGRHLTLTAENSVQILSVAGSADGIDYGYTPWTKPLSLGTNNAFYLEDSTITYGDDYGEDCIDCYGGARIVIRYNTFTNCHYGFHGLDSGQRRGMFSWETYHNTFINNTANTYRSGASRAGTGVIWSNIFSGTHGTWYDFTMLLYRATIIGPYTWGYCDGTQWDISNVALDTAVAAGTGRRFTGSPDGPLSSGGTFYLDGAGSHGYPGRDQPGRTHDQALAPIYEWNNGTVHAAFYDGGGTYPPGNVGVASDNWVQENRDFYNYQAGAFNGTVGTGQGLKSARPATCTTGVGYFATDENIFYVATSTNTWGAYYAPYTYPYPTSGGGTTIILLPARMI